MAQLIKWKEAVDRLIVCLDANEHKYMKELGKALMRNDSLNLKEAVGDFMGRPVGLTFFGVGNQSMEWGQ